MIQIHAVLLFGIFGLGTTLGLYLATRFGEHATERLRQIKFLMLAQAVDIDRCQGSPTTQDWYDLYDLVQPAEDI